VPTYTVVNDLATRERLTGAAIRGFLRIAVLWGLSRQERVALLGAGRSRTTLQNWERRAAGAVLSADELMRVSLLVAIYEGLQRVWRRAPATADAWVRRPRHEWPFHGHSPLAFMLDGGIPALIETRQYVDGITEGPPSRADDSEPPGEAVEDWSAPSG